MNRLQTISLMPHRILDERLNSLRSERDSIIAKKNRLTEAEERAKCAIRRLESEIALRDSGSKIHPS